MKKGLICLCVLLAGCNPYEPEAGKRADITEPDTGTEEPGNIPDDPEKPQKVTPIVDGFDWVDYGTDSVKIQFKIHNAVECEMQSASIIHGTDIEHLKTAATSVYPNGIIVATVSKPEAEIKREIVACEVITPVMTYRTEFYSLTF